ncbi:MAG: gliding motility protein GldL [Bacteroidetes bacterium]|nr:gliding motility protein GldL [Bacteroidota bacterium]HET6243244.1 gliding motility protein GldL [Bacteroidia bacterium]
MGFISSLQSKGGKKFMGYLYGWGAAIVIVGAMFKIQHWPFAGPMLVAGLSIEAVIFFFSAFEPIHEDPDWSLVYPELRGEHGHGGHDEFAVEEEETGTITEQLDKMLEEAKIEPELLASLGTGLRALSDQTSKLNNITDASAATTEFVSNIKSASGSMKQLDESYIKASESLSSLSVSSENGANYSEQLAKVSKNLAALNSVYELQYQSSNDQLQVTNKMYDGIGQLMQNLNDSLEDTQKYKENIADLAKNLGALNTVYGNMLNAMNVRA